MNVTGMNWFAEKWSFSAHGKRSVNAQQGHHPPGIVTGFFDALVAADRRASQNFNLVAGFGKHPGNRVIVTRISIENDRSSWDHSTPFATGWRFLSLFLMLMA